MSIDPNRIQMEPTDPDTLKILEKITEQAKQQEKMFNDPVERMEAALALQHGLERRESAPDHVCVAGTIITDSKDKKVLQQRQAILGPTTESPSLHHRVKKHS